MLGEYLAQCEVAVGAGDRIRTCKGRSPETCEVSAFTDFATPAPLARSTYHGSREATNGRLASPPNRGGSIVSAVVRVVTERAQGEADVRRRVAGPSQDPPQCGGGESRKSNGGPGTRSEGERGGFSRRSASEGHRGDRRSPQVNPQAAARGGFHVPAEFRLSVAFLCRSLSGGAVSPQRPPARVSRRVLLLQGWRSSLEMLAVVRRERGLQRAPGREAEV